MNDYALELLLIRPQVSYDPRRIIAMSELRLVG